MGLKLIWLELAQTPKFPNGSRPHSHEFAAALDGKGPLNASAWAHAKVSS